MIATRTHKRNALATSIYKLNYMWGEEDIARIIERDPTFTKKVVYYSCVHYAIQLQDMEAQHKLKIAEMEQEILALRSELQTRSAVQSGTKVESTIKREREEVPDANR
jgi:hypothetical protein